MVFMPRSPLNRTIQKVAGNPSEIQTRGSAIETLGNQMLDSADTLEDIKNRAIEDGSQKGKAIEALREAIGDTYSTLREAGNLYQPVGPVIYDYGVELEKVQPKINAHVEECESLWQTFMALPGSVEPRGTGGPFQPEDDSPEAEEQADEDQAKKDAYDAWELEAGAFDTDYDTWEEAYDAAVNDIGDEISGSIKDSFWSGLSDILGWVALGLGIAALIIGGPIVAALAALAAVAYLVTTYMAYRNGERSVGDVVLAAVGIFPFGKLSNVTKLLHFNGPALKAFAKGGLGNFGKLSGLFSKPAIGKGSLIALGREGGAKAVIKQLALGSQGYKAVRRTHISFYMGNRSSLISGLGAVRNLARIDFAAQFVGNLNRYNGYLDKAGLPHLTPPTGTGVVI